MKFFWSIFFAGFAMLFSFPLHAQVKLPQIFRDSMILQRDAAINIWGRASSGESITIKFNGKIYRTKTGKDGKWKLQLNSMKAGGPYTMQVQAKNTITLKNILIGDVWLCAGQSNMEHQMRLHEVLYAKEIAAANNPQIRQFKVPRITDLEKPRDELPGENWEYANPNSVREFSAVAYFFAKKLYEQYKVPIGIINASWGGTPIEAWMGEAAFKEFPTILQTIEINKDKHYIDSVNNNQSSFPPPARAQDMDKGMQEKWFSPAYQPKGWRTIAVPGYWEDQGVKDLNGEVWYRREVDVPASMINKPAKVFLGRIVDADELFINGTSVGRTYYMYPQRRYEVPNGLLKAGKNLFVVRITNNNGKGGFVPDKPYQLIAGTDTVDITGYWQYKVGKVFDPLLMPASGGGIALQNQPTALYNGMLAPIIPYTLKGFAWYQGESNSSRADEYAKLQLAMINYWRQKWNQPNASFLFVQLPGFMDYNYLPVESGWAGFREAQAKTLELPKTAMAVAIDLGEWNDIHPDRKKEVGDRLAIAAQKVAYGENIVHSGPVFKSATINGNEIIVTFDHVGSGLATSDGEPPAEFAIAGADKKFVWAEAKIENDKIIVSSHRITEPKYVRYAWADNPVNPNLVNKEGLPAAPFRTDR